MKIKENLKLLVIFTIALLSIVLLTAKVQAEDTELTDEQKYDIIAQTILDEIPDTVETDLKEIENIKGNANKKLPTEIIEDASGEKLDEIIKKLGGIGSGGDISISLDDDFNIDSSYKYSDINDFYKAKVVVKINNSYSKTNYKNYIWQS